MKPHYADTLPIQVSDRDITAFLHGEKSIHITPMDPQPDLIRNGRPYKDIRQKWERKPTFAPIAEPFHPVGTNLYLPEPFTILNEIYYEKSTVVKIKYEFDQHVVVKQIGSEWIENQILFTPNIRYPGSALPNWLSRKYFTVKSHTCELLHDISEREASKSGLGRRCGGYYYDHYGPRPGGKDLYYISALKSLRTLWDWELRPYLRRKSRWSLNPYVWVSTFQCLDSASS